MRSWWKTLGLMAGMACGLSFAQITAHAQFPPPGGGGFGMPPGGGMMGMPVNMGAPPGGGMGMSAFSGMPPGPGADFPNVRPPSEEPVSPFSIKDEGMPNAFTDLHDPRGRINAPYVVVFRGEYLSWYVPKGPNSAALVTTSTSATDPIPGALGQPNTQVLVPISNTLVDYGRLNGYRWTVGLGIGYVPPVEVSGFSFNSNHNVFQGGSSGATLPYLARPVQLLDIPIAPGIGTEDVIFVNVPTVANGSISIVSSMDFSNVDANLFFNFCCTDALKLDMLVGYRNTQFDEGFTITNTLGGNVGAVRFNNVSFPTGFSTTAVDSFRTSNTFNGGQIGLRSVLTYHNLSFFGDYKFAFGNTRSALTIDGNSYLTQVTPGRTQQTLPGGVLALPSNFGTVSQNEISIIPEVNLTLSYQLHPNFRFFGGYNILYWNRVIRPGDHINSVVDSRQIPTDQNYNRAVNGISPAFPALRQRDFFAHGFNVGIEIGF